MSRAFGGTSVTSPPPISNWPPEMVSSPAIMLSVVVLPHPDGPTSTTNEPSAISRLSRGMTTCAPKRFSMSTRETLANGAPFPSALDRADKIAAGNPSVGENEQDHDRDLRDDQTRRGQVERGNVAVAVEFEHADGDGKDRLAIQEHEGEHELLPDRDEVQRVANDDAGDRERQDHLGEDLEVRRAFDLRRLLDIARDGRHEAAQDQNLRRHAVNAMNDDQANAGVEQMQPAQDVVERNENRLLRQHQPRQQQREYVSLARRLEPAQRERRHNREPDCQSRAEDGVEQAVLHEHAEMEALPNLHIGLEGRRDWQRKRPVEELAVRLDRGDHHERQRTDPDRREQEREERREHLRRGVAKADQRPSPRGRESGTRHRRRP